MKPTVPTRTVRCAIYTRKSTEEGLEQEFNSLDAQRESAEAYIASQKHDGWVALPDRYDDGGFSGGNLERPALGRLLEDIKAKRVDCVVVYKVDRLSRSLFDFAKVVEIFDASGVSFVSVTQQFNTTTSMGRLTLNILLSFAQFEREVIGERIRDKMSASRKKGKWVGGRPPLGYDVDFNAKKLVVNPDEAVLVRRIFTRFVQLRSNTALMKELQAEGLTSKTWTTKTGKVHRGVPLDRNSFYKMLSNFVYIGKVSYKGSIYQGEHEAIIDMPLWNEVHEILAEPKQSRANRSRSKTYALLSGLVRCHHCGRTMSENQGTSHTGARHRYYRCQGSMKRGADSCQLSGLNAINLESVVVQHLRHVLASPEVLARIGPQIEPAKGEIDHQQALACMKRIDEVWDQLFPMERNRIAKLLIDKVVVSLDRVVMRLKCRGYEHLAMEIGGASVAFPEEGIAEIPLAVQARRRCGRTTLIRPADPTALAPEAQVPKPRPEDEAPDELTLALARAFAWQRELESGKFASVTDLARRENVHESYIRRQLQLTLLAPSTVRKILDGTHDWAISLNRITKQEVPAVWAEQDAALAAS